MLQEAGAKLAALGARSKVEAQGGKVVDLGR
jgi:hypothetical protein